MSVSSSRPAAPASAAIPWPNLKCRRPAIPYSIIPGGIQNTRELNDAIASDPVVARHYADFDLSSARTVRLNRDRAVYVSYRLGDRVYWTAKKLTLFKGEMLFTDGSHEARTRCGNRVSETPQQPTSPKEPPEEAFGRVEDPGLLASINPNYELPLTSPPTTDIRPPSHRRRVFVLPIVPLWWGSGSPAVFSGPTPLPGVTPEPNTFLLLSTGLSGLWLLRHKRKS